MSIQPISSALPSSHLRMPLRARKLSALLVDSLAQAPGDRILAGSFVIHTITALMAYQYNIEKYFPFYNVISFLIRDKPFSYSVKKNQQDSVQQILASATSNALNRDNGTTAGQDLVQGITAINSNINRGINAITHAPSCDTLPAAPSHTLAREIAFCKCCKCDPTPICTRLIEALNKLSVSTAMHQRETNVCFSPLHHVFYHDFPKGYSAFADLSFSAQSIELLVQCCHLPWHRMEPTEIASLLTSIMAEPGQAGMGQHYTSKSDVLSVLRPLFLNELEERFRQSYNSSQQLVSLLSVLAQIRILDPACGCGHFLLVSFEQIHSLFVRITRRVQQLHGENGGFLCHRAGNGSLLENYVWCTDGCLPSGCDLAIDSFAGIELQPWPAAIAASMLLLVFHGTYRNTSVDAHFRPLSDSHCNVHIANALQVNWRSFLLPTAQTYVVGNPPFVGARRMTAAQKADMKRTFGTNWANLDYAAAWIRKATDYFENTPGDRICFVVTSSLCQGVQASACFGNLLCKSKGNLSERSFDNSKARWRIRFAYKDFAWHGGPFDDACVRCHIIALDRQSACCPVFYTYHHKNQPVQQKTASNINAFLLDAPDIVLTSRSHPFSPDLPGIRFGSMPNDGGALVVTQQQYNEVYACPVARKYLREFPGAHHLLHNEKRWCLWLEQLHPSDLQSSTILQTRIEACEAYRRNSRRAATRKLAQIPHLFAERRQPLAFYVTLPRHVSSVRPYFIAIWTSPQVIAADSNFTVHDPDGLVFSLVSSSMFLAWMHIVAGRIGSSYRFSASPVWNHFPVPSLPSDVKQQIQQAGKMVRQARIPDQSLADQYRPHKMSKQLMMAHQYLDRIVDAAFHCQLKDNDYLNRQSLAGRIERRQACLFENYQALT